MSSPRVQVVVRNGREDIGRYDLLDGVYTLGRDPACDFPLDIPRVAQKHAQLNIGPHEWLLEDLGSLGGTFVDGQRLTAPVRLQPGQRIVLGDAHLELFAWADRPEPDGSAAPDEFLDAPRYQVGRMVKHGGMGGILEARETTIRRTVAMKMMLQERPEAREEQRFIQEAQVTGQLEHPNIVPVHDLGVNERGQVFYTMKFVDGVTLHDILGGLKNGEAEMIERYPLALLLTVFQKICDAVAFAHSRGVVHRDLKPANVMIGRFGEVLVMDWGLAKLVSRTAGRETPAAPVTAVSDDPSWADGLTLKGGIMGSLPYMAPEQAEGLNDEIGAATDIYALGSILYHLLVLEPPIRPGSLSQRLAQIRAGDFPAAAAWNTRKEIKLPHLPGKSVPEALSAVAMKCLRYAPSHRYPSVGALQRDITAYQGGFATDAEKAGPLRQLWLLVQRHGAICGAVAAALLLIVVVTAFFLQSLAKSNMALVVQRDAAELSRRDVEEQKAKAERALQRAQDELGKRIVAEKRRDESEVQTTIAHVGKTKAEETARIEREARERAAQRLLENESEGLRTQALAALDAGKLDDALRDVKAALAKQPDFEGHKLHGRILQSQVNFVAAAEAWQKAKVLRPDDSVASVNYELCRRLGQKPFDPRALEELRLSMYQQGRRAEAGEILARACAALMKEPRIEGTITRDAAGLVTLQTTASPTSATWAALPVSRLILDGGQAADLSLLVGSPLTALSLRGCAKVGNLTPLASIPGLRELDLTDCVGLTDLTPLLKVRSLAVLTLPAHLERPRIEALLSPKLPNKPLNLEKLGRAPIELVVTAEFLRRWNSGAKAREALAQIFADRSPNPRTRAGLFDQRAADVRLQEQAAAMKAFMERLIARYGEAVDERANLAAALAWVHGPRLPAIHPHPLVLRASFRRNSDPLALFAYFTQRGVVEAIAAQPPGQLIHVVDFFGEVAELEQARSLARPLLAVGANPLSLLAEFPRPGKRDGSDLLPQDVWPEEQGAYTPANLSKAARLPLSGAGSFAHAAYGACALLKSVGIPCRPVFVQPAGKDFCSAWIRVFWQGKWADFGERTLHGEEVTEATPPANRFRDFFLREPGTWGWIGELREGVRGSTPDPANEQAYPQLAMLPGADAIFELCEEAVRTKQPLKWREAKTRFYREFSSVKTLQRLKTEPNSLPFFINFIALNFVQEVYDYGLKDEAKEILRHLGIPRDQRFLPIDNGQRTPPQWRLPVSHR